jgi:methylthioxylose transferase
MSTAAARRRVPIAVSGAMPAIAVGGAAVVVAVGLALHAAGVQLGVPLPPFVMRWEPVASLLWVAVATLVIGGAVVVAPWLLERVRSPRAFACGAYVLALVLGLALNAARVGPAGWSKVFLHGPHGSVESEFEYLLALPVLKLGIPYYLRHFAQLLPQTTTHVKGNPPGPLIALHLLGIGSADALAWLCILVGALCAPLAYDLGRVLGDERRGRIAALLTAFSPCTLLFGVTSVDYVFATMAMVVACLLARPGGRWLLAGSIAAAVASFFSWLLLAIPAWAAVVAVERRGWRRAAGIALACAAAVAAWNGALWAAYGYDPFSAFSATHGFYVHGIATERPYAFWLFGSPVAWAVMLGLPVVWFALRALAAGDAGAIATCALVLVAALLGFTKAETERVWLPFVPLACVAAAAALRTARLRPLLAFLAVQALAVEILFFTIW